jgi:arsenical pump membrane protein
MQSLIRVFLTLAIFAATLVGILFRPRRMNEGVAALIGGGLVVVTGLVALPEAGAALLADWNVFLFFLGMMALSALAEQAGFFDWAAAHVARLARGSQPRLLIGIMLLGTLTSTLLSNDATALILTPIVFNLVKKLDLDPLPFTFACVFIADTASFVLPVSNPINIILLDAFHLSLGEFLRLLLLPSVVVIAMNILLFRLIFRQRAGGRFEATALGDPDAGVRDRGFFRFTLAVLGLVAVAYITCSMLQIPLSLVAVGGALALFIGGRARGATSPRRTARAISWPIFGFIAGMLLVVRAVEDAGIAQAFGQALLAVGGARGDGHHSTLVLIGVTTIGGAVGANLINNIPMAFVMTAVLRHISHLARRSQLALVGATIFGCDLGPNLTTVGSLAKVFWLLLLRQRGLKVSALDYFKIGILVTPPMLIAGSLVLWLLVR